MLIGQILWVLLLIESNGNMSSNSTLTHSKGPSDGTSLPPHTRRRKDANTEADSAKSMTTQIQHQADGHSQLENAVEWASPFARPGSRAGASTAPANKYFLCFRL